MSLTRYCSHRHKGINSANKTNFKLPICRKCKFSYWRRTLIIDTEPIAQSSQFSDLPVERERIKDAYEQRQNKRSLGLSIFR